MHLTYIYLKRNLHCPPNPTRDQTHTKNTKPGAGAHHRQAARRLQAAHPGRLGRGPAQRAAGDPRAARLGWVLWGYVMYMYVNILVRTPLQKQNPNTIKS
jgi:hypothetical protein